MIPSPHNKRRHPAATLAAAARSCCLILLVAACGGPTSVKTADRSTGQQPAAPVEIIAGPVAGEQTPLATSQTMAYAAWHWHHSNSRYQPLAENALRQHGLPLVFSNPADIADFCPPYPQFTGYQRLQFWSSLLAAMSQFESSHNTAAKHVERFNDRFGQPVVSRGLLQISQESANGYGCDIAPATELHEAEENISCGVRILSRWVQRDGRIIGYDPSNKRRPWRGGARYWSVLRNNYKTASIQENLLNSRLCQAKLASSAAFN